MSRDRTRSVLPRGEMPNVRCTLWYAVSGIVGVVAHDGRVAVSHDELDDLVAAYRSHRGGEQRASIEAGTLARFALIEQEGLELCDLERRDASWAAVVGTGYHEGSLLDCDAGDVDGQFAFVSYHSGREELVVACDAFGMQSLFVAERGGRTYISTSALALATLLRSRPSRRGIEIFLRCGYHFGTMTNWEGIERLDPATLIRFTPARRERTTYWRPAVDDQLRRLRVEDASSYCSDVTLETFRRCFRPTPPTWSDLTGGYDSRLLNLFLARANARFRTTTSGDESHDDVRIAREVARLAGWEWIPYSLPANWPQMLPPLAREALVWSDGHLDVLQAAEVLWGHREKCEWAKSLVTGGGGEHFRGNAWQQEFLNAGRSTRVNLDNWVNMRLVLPVETSVFARDPTEEVRRDVGLRMRGWAEPYADELNTVQLDVMKAYKMTGHFGAYGSLAASYLRFQVPFYLKPIFTAAISTDHRVRNHHRLIRHMMRRLDPRVAALPTDKGGPAEPLTPTNFYRFFAHYGTLGRKAVNKLTQKRFGRGLLAPPPRALAVAARRSALEMLDGREDLRAGSLRAAPLFDHDALDALLRGAGRSDFPHTRLLGRIVTVELLLREAGASLDS